MNKKKYITITIIAVIVIGLVLALKNVTEKKESETTSSSKKDLGIPINLVGVDKNDIIEDLNYIGTISPNKSVIVSPTIGGQIVDIYVDEGDLVQSGDLLAKIEDSEINASYDTAEKKLESLETNKSYLNSELESFYNTSPLVKKQETLASNYEYIKEESEKYKQLYEEGAIAKTEYNKIKQEENTIYLQLAELKATTDDTYSKLKHERDMVEGQINEVRSSLQELEIKMDKILIKAPRKGIVKKIYYEKGELAAMGMPFVDIDDNDELLVNVNITESDLKKINIGDDAILNVESLDSKITTKVSKLIPNINPSTRVGTLEIGPIKVEEGSTLISGSSIDVSIIINEVKDKLVIPKSTIKKINDESIVYLYEDGKVKEKKIKTGLTVGEMTEVVEGLEEGDKIASTNLSKLYENAKVYVFEGVEKK